MFYYHWAEIILFVLKVIKLNMIHRIKTSLIGELSYQWVITGADNEIVHSAKRRLLELSENCHQQQYYLLSNMNYSWVHGRL